MSIDLKKNLSVFICSIVSLLTSIAVVVRLCWSRERGKFTFSLKMILAILISGMVWNLTQIVTYLKAITDD